MAGLGFAPEPTAAPSPAAPARVPMLDRLGPRPATAAAPLANLSTSQKIGALLQDFGRGVAGRPSYTDELIAQRTEQEALELERMNVGVNAMTKGLELLQKTPAAQREVIAKQYGQMYEHLIPGFTETLAAAAQEPEATKEQLAALGEHANTLIAVGGSLDGALKLAQNSAFMAQLNDASDERNAPEIVSALERGRDTLAQSPEGKALWDQMTRDGLTISDLMDPQFQGALGLTQSHVNSIMRSPAIQSTLRPLGFVPTADADKKAQAEAGRESPQDAARRAGGIAAAEAAAREAAKMITFLGPNNAVIRRPQGEAEALRAQGFQPLVTGRTEADADAISKAQTKDTADKSVPVDAYFARIAGVDPKTTIQEAIDQGLTPEIDDTTKRALQGAETGMRGITGLIGQARAIVEQNPNANTRVAALGGLVTNIKAELDSLGRSTGIKIDVDRELKGREDIFKSNGIDNALMKQLAIGLAYMNAKSLDDSGRLSDADVRNSAKALGAGASDPAILLNLLDQAELTADDSFRNRVQSATGKRRDSSLPDVKAAEDIAKRIEAGEEVTREEMAQLSPRARRALKARLSNAD